MIPGAVGSALLHLRPTLEGFDEEKFTVVALDPPGYGKSRPPERTFGVNYFHDEADITYEFMKKLDVRKYSVLGWSAGGTVGCLLAATHPEVVNKLVVWAVSSFVLPLDLKHCQARREIGSLADDIRLPLIELYGKETYARLWAGWTDSVTEIYEKNNGYLFDNNLLNNIKCPTLILQGVKDQIMDKLHGPYLNNKIRGSRLYQYPEGKHNIHLRYAEDFNKRVQEFLLQP